MGIKKTQKGGLGNGHIIIKGGIGLKKAKFVLLSRIVAEPYYNSDIFEKSRPPPPWVLKFPKGFENTDENYQFQFENFENPGGGLDFSKMSEL